MSLEAGVEDSEDVSEVGTDSVVGAEEVSVGVEEVVLESEVVVVVSVEGVGDGVTSVEAEGSEDVADV